MKTVLLVIGLLAGMLAQGQRQHIDDVNAVVDEFRKALLSGDSIALDRLVLPELSYGHSSGLIENRDAFIRKLSSGQSDFVTLELSNQSIIVSGKTAIVRHDLDAMTNDSGKTGQVKLHVMLVWQKHKGNWKLLARQAARKPV